MYACIFSCICMHACMCAYKCMPMRRCCIHLHTHLHINLHINAHTHAHQAGALHRGSDHFHRSPESCHVPSACLLRAKCRHSVGASRSIKENTLAPPHKNTAVYLPSTCRLPAVFPPSTTYRLPAVYLPSSRRLPAICTISQKQIILRYRRRLHGTRPPKLPVYRTSPLRRSITQHQDALQAPTIKSLRLPAVYLHARHSVLVAYLSYIRVSLEKPPKLAY